LTAALQTSSVCLDGNMQRVPPELRCCPTDSHSRRSWRCGPVRPMATDGAPSDCSEQLMSLRWSRNVCTWT